MWSGVTGKAVTEIMSIVKGLTIGAVTGLDSHELSWSGVTEIALSHMPHILLAIFDRQFDFKQNIAHFIENTAFWFGQVSNLYWGVNVWASSPNVLAG